MANLCICEEICQSLEEGNAHNAEEAHLQQHGNAFTAICFQVCSNRNSEGVLSTVRGVYK